MSGVRERVEMYYLIHVCRIEVRDDAGARWATRACGGHVCGRARDYMALWIKKGLWGG